jgi:DNA-binding HxlR family transcriptional regulator
MRNSDFDCPTSAASAAAATFASADAAMAARHGSVDKQRDPLRLGAEIFAERWTPLIVRELLHGPRRLAAIERAIPHISRNLLTKRLSSLIQAGVIERRLGTRRRRYEYELTEIGRELRPVIEALGAWACRRIGFEPMNDDDWLIAALHHSVRADRLPHDRAIVLFNFWQEVGRRYWVVLDRSNVEVHARDIGLDVDIELAADFDTLGSVWLGYHSLHDAIRAGAVTLTGSHRHVRDLPDWFGAWR